MDQYTHQYIMSEAGFFIIVLQIYFCVHVFRHDKERFWIFIIVLVPLIGCIVYFLTQVLPDLLHDRKLKRVGVSLINTLDPQREIRRLQDELEVSDSIENRLLLADAYVQANQPAAAIELYEKCLTGIHEDDPDILLKLAQACFSNGEHQKAKNILDKLMAGDTEHKSYDGHLLYAKVLESLNLTEQAVREYEILSNGYPGEEARVRYGLLLKKMGQEDQAQVVFRETLTRIKRAPRFYLKKEKYWIEIANENLK